MKNIPINQPTLPALHKVTAHLKRIFKSRIITNGPYVAMLEEQAREYLKVPSVVALSSNTSALILTLKALGITGRVLCPSFTFCATAHALLWNNITPVFADCDPATFNIDYDDVKKKIKGSVSAIIAVHVFGNPLDMKYLQSISKQKGVPLIIDAAHALGSLYRGRSVASFADASVFSLAPTKLTTSAEGGLVATASKALAAKLRLLRNYGNPPDYDCVHAGLNARLSEIHAALGIESLKLLKRQIARRNELAHLYKHNLSDIKGIRFQSIDRNNLSTYNYFAIVIDKKRAGIDAARLKAKLSEHGIQTKRYFFPPVHKQRAYRDFAQARDLATTETLSDSTLCLPLYSHLDETTVNYICRLVHRVFKSAA